MQSVSPTLRIGSRGKIVRVVSVAVSVGQPVQIFHDVFQFVPRIAV